MIVLQLLAKAKLGWIVPDQIPKELKEYLSGGRGVPPTIEYSPSQIKPKP